MQSRRERGDSFIWDYCEEKMEKGTKNLRIIERNLHMRVVFRGTRSFFKGEESV